VISTMAEKQEICFIVADLIYFSSSIMRGVPDQASNTPDLEGILRNSRVTITLFVSQSGVENQTVPNSAATNLLKFSKFQMCCTVRVCTVAVRYGMVTDSTTNLCSKSTVQHISTPLLLAITIKSYCRKSSCLIILHTLTVTMNVTNYTAMCSKRICYRRLPILT
jgi:hypothetical protein